MCLRKEENKQIVNDFIEPRERPIRRVDVVALRRRCTDLTVKFLL